MVFYVEKGVEFTCRFGDMYEAFYSSLESMFDRILAQLNKYPELLVQFQYRLESIVSKTDGMGWGFNDYLYGSLDIFLTKYSDEHHSSSSWPSIEGSATSI